MPRIFISYRRDESGADMARLRDRLAQRFGAADIFVDVQSIDLGRSWIDAITQAVASCDCLLALIGPRWAELLVQRELSDDYVVIEIRTALFRDISVIPVLLGGASMPTVALPVTIRGLIERQAIEIHEDTFDADVLRLSEAIREALAVRGAA